MAGKSNRGRKGGTERIRQLLVLLSSLAKEGDTVDVRTVAERLSVSDEEARKLMLLLLEIAQADEYPLAFAMSDDEREITLINDDGGRPVRLSRAESFAVIAAFDRIGISADNPIRQTVQASFARHGISDEEVRKGSAPAETMPGAAKIQACVDAITRGTHASFPYKGGGDDEARVRNVDPIGLRQESGLWYLDAYDLDCKAKRQFRLDRMGDVHAYGRAETHVEMLGEKGTERKTVRLTIEGDADPNLFDWHESARRTLEDGSTEIETHYFEGRGWTARRIAGYGSRISCDNDHTREEARAWASRLLREYRELG